MRTWMWVLILMGAATAWASEPPAAPPSAAEPAAPLAPAGVEEVEPQMYYLRNENGDYVYVPNFSFEQWERLVQLARNLSDPKLPAYVLKELLLEGQVEQDHVRMQVIVEIERRAVADDTQPNWLRVPLHFSTAVLSGPPQFSEPGEHFFTFDARDGYVMWLQGQGASRQRVTLEFLLPLARAGDESQWTLSLPSPLASQLTLQVPENQAEGTLESRLDDSSRPLQFTARSPEGGLFTIRGLRGEVTVKWHRTEAVGDASDQQLDVFGTITVTANELLQEVRAEGRFVIRSFGTPIQRIRLQLPPGMRFRDAPEPGYKVQPVTVVDASGVSPQRVEVQVARPGVFEQSIRLVAELPPDQDNPASPLRVTQLVGRGLAFEPARFVIEGAARHRGRVDFTSSGDWAFQWVEHAEIVRTEQGADGITGNTARFNYYSQPCDLQVSLRQRATRISVEPSYELYLDPQQARLTATLVCQTSGARARPLALDLRGWMVEKVQFDDISSAMSLDRDQVDPLVVPIPSEVQAQGKFVVRVEARRELTAGVVSGTQPLRIAVPQLQAANPSQVNLIVAPANLCIVSAQNVVVTPRVSDIRGLSALAPAPPLADKPGQLPPAMRYRDHGSNEQAAFVCDFRVLPRSITAAVDSAITLTQDGWQVEQQLDYSVLHEPVTSLALRVPATLVRDGRVGLRLLLDEQPVAPAISSLDDSSQAQLLVSLPKPLLGQVQLRVLIPRQDAPSLVGNAPSRVSIPLVFPVATSLSQTAIVDNQVTLKYDKRLAVELAEGRWAVNETESALGVMRLTTAAEPGSVVVRVALRKPSTVDSTRVQQAWIQTWIVGAYRRDRAVFRVLTGDPQLRVELPQEADGEPTVLSVALDGHGVEPARAVTPGTLLVNLEPTPGKTLREHVLEIWYAFEAEGPRRGQTRLQCANVDGADRTVQSYWQLILPRDDMLLRGSPPWEIDWLWSWQGLGWQRAPRWEQVDLEDWIQASRQDPIPADTRRYVFTAFGAPHRLEVVSVGQSLVVLVASGLALIVGLLLVYGRWLRRPAVLIVVAAGVLAGALFSPELAVLAAQAGSLGLVLAVLAPVLRRLLRRDPLPPRPTPGRAATRDSKMLEVQFSHAEGSSRVPSGVEPRAPAASATESAP